MRRVALLIALAACGGASKHEPAWPKSAGHVAPETWEEDGGESIDPRTPNDVEQSDSDVPVDGDQDLGAAVGAAAGGTSVEVTVTPDATDEPPPPSP